jgi:hypothetical protein
MQQRQTNLRPRRFPPPWSVADPDPKLQRQCMCATAMSRRWPTSISRMSPAGARRRISSPATKPGASPPASPSCPTLLRKRSNSDFQTTPSVQVDRACGARPSNSARRRWPSSCYGRRRKGSPSTSTTAARENSSTSMLARSAARASYRSGSAPHIPPAESTIGSRSRTRRHRQHGARRKRTGTGGAGDDNLTVINHEA